MFPRAAAYVLSYMFGTAGHAVAFCDYSLFDPADGLFTSDASSLPERLEEFDCHLRKQYGKRWTRCSVIRSYAADAAPAVSDPAGDAANLGMQCATYPYHLFKPSRASIELRVSSLTSTG